MLSQQEKDAILKQALLESIDHLNNHDYNKIRELIDDALQSTKYTEVEQLRILEDQIKKMIKGYTVLDIRNVFDKVYVDVIREIKI